jgi:hypothetical protein
MTDTSSRKRASRYIRLNPPPPIVLTARDKEVVRLVNDYRVIRQEHIEKLLFPSKNTAQKRLWLLWQNSFLKREFLPVFGGVQNSPILYLLDREGVDLLQTEFGYERHQLRWFADTLGQQFLRHTLGLGDIRVAMTRSAQRHNRVIQAWNDETAMKAQYDRVPVGNRMVSLIPDSHFVLEVPGGVQHFFVEFDRGPERLKVLAQKVKTYERYFESGLCFKRYGTDKIRVLIVVEGTKKRLDNLKELAEKSHRRHHFWFSTLESIIANDALTAPYWERAGETKVSFLIAVGQ